MSAEPSGAVAPGSEGTAAGRWPDFVGIGTIKSGTTWLWQCLRQHPQLYLPRMKELEYFDTRFDLGTEWYTRFFAEAGSRVCGEISPQYVHNPAAIDRMAPLAGRVKLIVCLRNPVERAYSHFSMDARAFAGLADAEKAAKFDELVRAGGSKYVEFGRYADQLEPYFQRFGRDSIHAILFEDIESDPARVIRDACRFLGVDETFLPDDLRERVNASKRYRSVHLFKGLQGIVRLAEKAGLGRLILALKRTAVRDRVLQMLEVPQAYAPMLPATRARLVEFYAPGNARLERRLGRDLSGWNRV